MRRGRGGWDILLGHRYVNGEREGGRGVEEHHARVKAGSQESTCMCVHCMHVCARTLGLCTYFNLAVAQTEERTRCRVWGGGGSTVCACLLTRRVRRYGAQALLYQSRALLYSAEFISLSFSAVIRSTTAIGPVRFVKAKCKHSLRFLQAAVDRRLRRLLQLRLWLRLLLRRSASATFCSKILSFQLFHFCQEWRERKRSTFNCDSNYFGFFL